MGDLSNTDHMVLEYLVYRGFTQTYKSMENEALKDKTKQFDAKRLVETISGYLQSGDIHSFISLWDFLSKRFFTHLDSDHHVLSTELKADLLKFYLMHSFKKSKDRIIDFFSCYSHDILAATGVAGALRPWFVLPYMENPQEDPEFAVYFSSKWSENLFLTLSNFLSIVLRSAPPPKLLLLDRWFASEAQQEIRSQLKLSFQKVDILVNRLEKSEERLLSLREVIKELATYIQKSRVCAPSRGASLFEVDEQAELAREKSRELGQLVCKEASECVTRGNQIMSLSQEARLKELVGKDVAAILFLDRFGDENKRGSDFSQPSMEELERNLVEHIQTWLKSLSS